MKTLFIILLISSGSFAQINIDNTSYSTNELVEDILLTSGSNTSVSNVNFRGCLNVSGRYQLGYFSTATTTLSDMNFSDGIVLSTGNTADIPLGLGINPGSVAQMSRNYTSGTPGEIRSSNAPAGQDQDAQVLIAPENYYNAAILEFDFIAQSSFVSFRYIFGSEEYDDESGSAFGINYNCSSYNDQFAFLLSGPGISGGLGYQSDAINLATLSNGSSVGINSVNNGNVGSSGGFPNASNCSSANPDWSSGAITSEFKGFIDGTELNGNTEPLIASYAGLTVGQTYHIRILIADSDDGAYDSVVYLEGNSFDSDPNPLPIELIDFSGECQNDANLITWTTATEHNSDYFVIEKMDAFNGFIPIDTIQAAGQSTMEIDYSFMDIRTMDEDVSYYRLQQVDFNGEKEYSSSLAISGCETTQSSILIGLNSAQDLNLFLYEINGQTQIEIYAVNGQLVLSQSYDIKSSNTIKSLSLNLANGSYVVQVKNGVMNVSERIVLHR